MITVETAPPLVALLGNPVRFRLSSDNYIDTAGVNAVFTISFTDTGHEPDEFTLSWGDQEQRFVCRATPNASGNELSDYTNEANLNNWVALIASELAMNYYIDRDFVVTSSGADLILTAREAGAGYTITWEKIFHAPDPTTATTAGVDEVIRPFYKLGVQVLIKDGSNWIKCGEDILPVDESGEALFDIHTLFTDRVYPEFKYPEASDAILTRRDYHCREYRIRYYEQYGEDLTPGILTETSSYYILAAGISTLQEAIYNRQDSSLWEKFGYNQYFLTWSPKTKYVDRWTTEKLYFLVQSSIANLVMKIAIHYNDGTSTSTISKATVASPVVKSVYEVVCSLNVLQLTGYDNDNIDYYEVWMEDGSSNRISEIRTFIMDYGYHDQIRQFLFRNSLGGYDTLRTTGEAEDYIQIERTSMRKVLGEGYTESDHQVSQLRGIEVKSYKANTGWVSQEQASWIRDFLLSSQVFQMVVGKLVPVVITTTQALQRKDRQDLFSIEFEYQRSYRSEYYTKEIVTAEFTDAFDDDFANE